MRIYLSIPVTGMDLKKQKEKADRIKFLLSKKGYEVVNPFDIYVGKNPGYFDYISYDIRALSECDAAFFCTGWQYSKGCRLEKAFCDIYGKKVKFETVEQPEIYYR